MAKLSIDELGEKLCDYCSLDDSQKGVRNYGDGPVFCQDSGSCERAYENYLEDEEDDNE